VALSPLLLLITLSLLVVAVEVLTRSQAVVAVEVVCAQQ
jgi:hypothetical protein